MNCGGAREEVSAGGIVFRYERTDMGALRPVFLLIRDSYRNWGFPKGHLEAGEGPQCAAVREVAEETGLDGLVVHGEIATIDWYFRFRGRLVHKVCHFFLMRTDCAATCPQREEGITACRWAPYEEAITLVSYANARLVLERAHVMVQAAAAAAECAAAREAACSADDEPGPNGTRDSMRELLPGVVSRGRL
ncbi:MAG TPA: NUDIX hydrolase [Gemmatirosa sp.]